MNIDTEKIDEGVLALLYLTLHENNQRLCRESMKRLHEKGLISNPIGKAKSVALAEHGLEQSEQLFRELFVKG